MLRFSSFVLSLFMASAVMADDRRDPMGEVANYKLDKGNGRTSFTVSKGTIKNTVARLVEDQTGKSYGVRIDYDVSLKITGNFKDSFEMVFPESFFTPAFMEELRARGSYVSDQYKIKYEGQADAINSDGSTYPDSDVLTIYDIKVDGQKGLYDLLCLAAGLDPADAANKGLPMQEMKIKAHVFQGIPALSAVKLDLSGKIKGVSSKLGFDLEKTN